MKIKTVTFFILLSSVLFFTQQVAAQCDPDDYTALRALYMATDGDNWTDNTGWEVSSATPPAGCDVCSWHGVTCTNTNGRISTLNLSDNNLVGNIPSEISKLSNLQTLQLSVNHLSGEIPIEIGQLTNLVTIFLYQNNLEGHIPAEIGQLTNLVTIFLYQNNLEGHIPAEIGSLNNLISLDLSNNNLSGTIPVEFSGLSNLVYLQLYTNELSGPIPDVLLSLNSLQNLQLDNNLFSGIVPDWLGDMSSLLLLSLSGNQLTGSIPISLSNLDNLLFLNLNKNKLTGSIPDEFGDMSNLQGLYLQNNQLSGSIPPELGNLTNLKALYLHNNQLSGNIPAALGNLPNIEILYLCDNSLTGDIPIELGNLSTLQQLYLCSNQLSGNIPAELGNLSALTLLYLYDNELTGSIPSELGNLLNLFWLHLYDNNLSGCIPSNFTSLCDGKIFIYDNPNLNEQDFTAFCNSSSGVCGGSNCDNSQHPDYEPLMALYNATNGPDWTNNTNWITDCDVCNWEGITCDDNGRVYIITLPNNNLSGELPSELGQLTELVEIFLDGNSLYGSIPEALYTIPTLENIILSNNFLGGGLSANICQLNNLNEIRLSNNQLFGEIPSCLGDFTNLLVINLGYNNFSGCYPSSWLTYCGNDQMNFEENICLRDWTDFCNTNGDCSGNTVGEHPDFAPLMALYNSTNGPTWTNNTNWGTCDPCTWYGVYCDYGRVRELNLENNNLVGTIPEEIGQLERLDVLILANNQLSGTVPDAIGNLFNMFFIVLSDNNLSGEFPDIFDAWHQIHDIRINNNNFEGPLPSSLGSRTTLRVVEFWNNNFSGCFPFSYKNLCTNKATVFESGFGFGGNPQLPNGGDFDAFCNSESGICNEDIGCEWVELEVRLGTEEVHLYYDFAMIEEGATYFIQSGGYYFGTNSPNATLNYFFELQPGTFQLNIANWANNGLEFFQLRNLLTGEILVDNQSFTDIYTSELFEVCPLEECPEELVWTTDFSDETTTLHATTIYANNNIVGSSNITYKAGNSVNLLPGFTVQAGSEFLATIEDCPPPINTIEPEIEQIMTTSKVANQNLTVYPNPFTNQTTIEYTLEEEAAVTLQIVDLLGQQISKLVADPVQTAGLHQVTFNRQQLQGGTYFVILQKGDQYESKKMILLE